jgi:hypothetical protein
MPKTGAGYRDCAYGRMGAPGLRGGDLLLSEGTEWSEKRTPRDHGEKIRLGSGIRQISHSIRPISRDRTNINM